MLLQRSGLATGPILAHHEHGVSYWAATKFVSPQDSLHTSLFAIPKRLWPVLS